jgi:hypothetical protein
MPKTYIIYLPAIEGSLEEELKLCLDQIEDTCSKGFIPVKLNIFVDLPDYESFLKGRGKICAVLNNTFKSGCPAFNITVQPPERPWKVAIEGTFISTGAYAVQMKKHMDFPYIIIESDAGKELWAAGVSSYSFPDDTGKAADKAFSLMNEILESEQMSIDNLVRQWNYIGNILEIKDNCQNYQLFNEVRNDYYTRFRKVKGYPAATGVGMMHGGVILDFCAFQPGIDTTIKPVENPHQLNAYEYNQQVLKGAVASGIQAKHPPQFERALLIVNRKEAILHISGTASILGQETVGKGDIEKQTQVTINNMGLLSDAGRLKNLVPGSSLSESRYSLLRVYVKRDFDFRRVREICQERYPGVPAVFIRADICRDDLLMEVEAEAELTF